MLAHLIFFLISILGIGLLVGRGLIYSTPQREIDMISTTTSPAWYTLDVAGMQKYLWLTFLFLGRYLLIVTVIRILLFVEKTSRVLAQKLHTFIEKTMKYHHVHH